MSIWHLINLTWNIAIRIWRCMITWSYWWQRIKWIPCFLNILSLAVMSDAPENVWLCPIWNWLIAVVCMVIYHSKQYLGSEFHIFYHLKPGMKCKWLCSSSSTTTILHLDIVWAFIIGQDRNMVISWRSRLLTSASLTNSYIMRAESSDCPHMAMSCLDCRSGRCIGPHH